MAKYSLVINSKFNPFSYQELLAPVQQSTQAHQMVEAQFGELAQKADAWKAAAMANPNSRAASMYQGYANDLDTQARRLSAEGLTSSSRQSALDMYRRYSSEILPIETAYKKREEQSKMQEQALLSNPTLLFSRRASTTGLDDYINNPELSYDTYSGNLLTSQVSSAAKNFANELRNYGLGKKIDPFTNSFIKEHGFSKEDVDEAVRYINSGGSSELSKEGNKVLTALVNNVISASGIAKWNDPNILKEALHYANLGLYDAIGKTDVTPTEDYGARLRYKKTLENPTPADTGILPHVEFKGNPINIYSREEMDRNSRILSDYLKYFDDNGNLNEEGLKKYNEKIVPRSPGEGLAVLYKDAYAYSKFKNDLDSLNGGEIDFSDKNNAKEFYSKLKSLRDSIYDATKSTEYRTTFTNEYAKTVLDNVVGSSDSNGNIYVSEWDPNTKSFSKKSKRINIKNLSTGDNGDVAGVEGRFGIHGSYVYIKMKNGEHLRVDTSSLNPSGTLDIMTRMSAANAVLEKNKNILAENGISTSDPEYTQILMGLMDQPIKVNGYTTTYNDLLNGYLNDAGSGFTALFRPQTAHATTN